MRACRRNRGTAQAADRYAAGGDHAAVRGRWGRATICAYWRYSRLGRNSALQEEMCSPGRMVAVCAGELRRRRDRAHHCAPRRRTSSSCTATGRSRACASSSRTGPGSPPPPRCWSGASRTSRSESSCRSGCSRSWPGRSRSSTSRSAATGCSRTSRRWLTAICSTSWRPGAGARAGGGVADPETIRRTDVARSCRKFRLRCAHSVPALR